MLYAGLRYGAKIKAYYVNTSFQPEFELNDAKKLAKHLGTEMTIIEKDILENKKVVSNPHDRCYYCKTAIFNTLRDQAIADGFTVILDGTNASDDAFDRPGMKALRELSVRSPLQECGITKNEVRRLSKEAGLFTWDKPAYACLATRIPSGFKITEELLQRIENSEDVLFSFGFSDFRVRVVEAAGDCFAKIQLPKEQLNNLMDKRHDVVKEIKQFFPSVLLDLEGRNE